MLVDIVRHKDRTDRRDEHYRQTDRQTEICVYDVGAVQCRIP